MKKILFAFAVVAGVFTGVAHADNNCTGATYYDSDTDTCIACPNGYDYNQDAGKTDITQCQIHCDGGTYVEFSGEYTRLEYIESSGTQYINTRRNFMYGDEFFFDYMPIASYSGEDKGYGTAGGASGEISGGGRRVNGNVTMYIVGSNISYSPTLSYNNALLHRYTEHWKINDGLFSSTLTDVSSGTVYSLLKSGISNSYNSNSTAYLFRANAGTPSHLRLYGTWLKRADGSYAFNMVPARRNSDGVLGMYDTVSGTFFTNAGTGTFVAGADIGGCVNVGAGYYAAASTVNFGSMGTRTACPMGTSTNGADNASACTTCTGATYADEIATAACKSCPTGYDYNQDAGKTDISQCQVHCDAGTYIDSVGIPVPGDYTPLEYIESTGTQYINTRRNFVYGDEFFFDYMPIASYSSEDKGYGTAGGASGEISGGGRRVYGNVTMYITGSNISYSPTLSYNNALLHRYTEHWKINDGLFSSTLTDVSSGTVYSLLKSGISNSYNSNSTAYLFRANAGTPSHLRLYGTWLKRANGNYAFNMIPVRRNSDGVIGMYDTVTGTFFTNAGTGTFIAGSNVGGCVNVGAGYYAPASTVNFGLVGTRTQCPAGLYTVGYGHGADDSNDCGRILHVGDNVIYTRRNKITTPSVNIKMDNGDMFYISLSPTDHTVSRLHFQYNGNEYTAYDDSLFYGERDFDTGEQIAQ